MNTSFDNLAEPAEIGMDSFQAAGWALRRDLSIALRSLADLAVVLVFFLLVTSLFPLALRPEDDLLRTIAPGVTWVAAVLASLLALPHLFAHEHADGSLEQLVLANAPLPALMAGKVVAHWLVTGLPIVLLAPFTGLQFGLNAPEIGVMAIALLLGTPILSWFGAVGAALTLGTRGGASLLALLVLPLTVPVLIFGA
ncbi:MAG: heme exporter protein CcmB, partial [Burkholderiaceae bacterium]